MSRQDPEKNSSKRHPDVYVGGALLAFCAVAYWNTTTFAAAPAMLSQNVPPTFFPRLVLATIAALCALLVARGWKLERDPAGGIPAAVLVTAAVITAVVALIPQLGMLSTSCLASVALALRWGERRAGRIALLALGLPLSIYVIFVLALGMRLPRGLLP